MTGINLLPQLEVEKDKWARLGRQVSAVTTVVLVMYIVAAAAAGGWWWYVRQRQVRLSAAAADLQQKIGSLAQTEVWWRLVADRNQTITEVLDSRPSLASQAGRLLGESEVTIVGWERETGTAQTVSVAAPSAQAVEDYAKVLAAFYRRVTLTTLTSEGGTTWAATLTLEL